MDPKTIDLQICHGFVLDNLSDEDGKPKIAWAKTDPERVHHSQLDSIQNINLADLHVLASNKIHEAFDIDVEKCKAGKGFLSEILVVVDMDDEKKQYRKTRMNVPNEGSWEASKHLIAASKGEAKVVYLFAVDKGKWLWRFAIRQFAS